MRVWLVRMDCSAALYRLALLRISRRAAASETVVHGHLLTCAVCGTVGSESSGTNVRGPDVSPAGFVAYISPSISDAESAGSCGGG